MEKLDKVMRALTCCLVNEDEPCEVGCPYAGAEGCVDKVMVDALEELKEYRKCLTGCGIRQYADAHMDEEVKE